MASKRSIESQSRSRREELLGSSVVTKQKPTSTRCVYTASFGPDIQANKTFSSSEDALMKANDDVTDAMRRTINLMQGELERSVLSTQLLGEHHANVMTGRDAYTNDQTNLLPPFAQLPLNMTP